MKSRLEGLRVYLSGPCEMAPDRGSTWRDNITPDLKILGMEVLDPNHKSTKLSFCETGKEEFEKLKKLRNSEDWKTLRKYAKEVVRADLRAIDLSDLVILYGSSKIPTVGTWHEFSMAALQKKPIYVIWEEGKKSCPLWLFGVIPDTCIFSSFEDAMKQLNYVAYCKDEDLEDATGGKYWYFLNNHGRLGV